MADQQKAREITFKSALVRQRRQELGWSVRHLAEICNVSPSFISQVERGITIPTMTKFWLICEALDTPPNAFMGGTNDESPVILRKADRPLLTFPERSETWERLTPRGNGNLGLMQVRIPAGSRIHGHPVPHKGDECGMVVSGQLVVILNDTSLLLEEGDSVYVGSGQPHRLENPGSVESVSIWANSPAAL